MRLLLLGSAVVVTDRSLHEAWPGFAASRKTRG
jgi:hypothetical protein